MLTMTYNLRRLGLGLAVIFFAVGCGKKLATATGQVAFPDKTPLTSGVVIFDPVDIKENPYGAQGTLQADGTFRLGSAKPGEGAHPGKYRVHIQKIDEDAERVEITDPELTIVDGPNHFLITVQKPGKGPGKKK